MHFLDLINQLVNFHVLWIKRSEKYIIWFKKLEIYLTQIKLMKCTSESQNNMNVMKIRVFIKMFFMIFSLYQLHIKMNSTKYILQVNHLMINHQAKNGLTTSSSCMLVINFNLTQRKIIILAELFYMMILKMR